MLHWGCLLGPVGFLELAKPAAWRLPRWTWTTFSSDKILKPQHLAATQLHFLLTVCFCLWRFQIPESRLREQPRIWNSSSRGKRKQARGVQWLFRLQLRHGTRHFCSHSIGQDKAQAKVTSMGQGSTLAPQVNPVNCTAMVRKYKTLIGRAVSNWEQWFHQPCSSILSVLLLSAFGYLQVQFRSLADLFKVQKTQDFNQVPVSFLSGFNAKCCVLEVCSTMP